MGKGEGGVTAEANTEAAGYRLNLSYVEAMQRRVEYEYTSKGELRRIAASALATLHAGYNLAAEAAEQQAVEAATNVGLIVPAEGLVMP